MRRPAVALLVLLTLLSACTYFTGDPQVVITSLPQGAEILVDGQPTGRTTPAKLDLGGLTGSDHAITLRKAGFEDESRRVYHYSTPYGARWIDGATEVELFSFPLFWTIGDFVLPFGVKWRYVPHEIYVKLYPQGQAPVHSGEAASAH